MIATDLISDEPQRPQETVYLQCANCGQEHYFRRGWFFAQKEIHCEHCWQTLELAEWQFL